MAEAADSTFSTLFQLLSTYYQLFKQWPDFPGLESESNVDVTFICNLSNGQLGATPLV